MDLTLDVYLTTKKDTLEELSSFKDDYGFYKWKSRVKTVAFHSDSFKEIDTKILDEASKHEMIEAYAVIEYPHGQFFEADDNVGEKLKELFNTNYVRFQYVLTRDEEAPQNSFKVSLDVICKKKE